MRSHSFAVVCALALPLLACSASNSKEGGGTLGGEDGGDDAGGGGLHLDGDPGGLGDVSDIPLDPTKDNDGDTYTYADDCDDRNPDINPGAYDVVGDSVDNDCNGKADDVDDCDKGLTMTGPAADLAKSLNLCRTTTAGATGKDKTWGVISAVMQTTDGKGAPKPYQYGIENTWGTVVKPKAGNSMAVLSTGSARTPGQPGYIKPLQLKFGDPGTGNENAPPAGWPKNSSGCPDPLDKSVVNDSVGLKLTIRVPTNAKGFSYDFDFYTSEYIDYVCSEFNDTFIALLKSAIAVDPKANGNISFDTKGNPVNVNSGFFEVCAPGSKSGHTFPCKLGRGELSGTGYEGDADQDGATSWLRTKASVKPGEEMEIEFVIWNTSDHILQSAVLLDNWMWNADGTTGAPVTDRPK
jgi:hypothetical protein